MNYIDKFKQNLRIGRLNYSDLKLDNKNNNLTSFNNLSNLENKTNYQNFKIKTKITSVNTPSIYFIQACKYMQELI